MTQIHMYHLCGVANESNLVAHSVFNESPFFFFASFCFSVVSSSFLLFTSFFICISLRVGDVVEIFHPEESTTNNNSNDAKSNSSDANSANSANNAAKSNSDSKNVNSNSNINSNSSNTNHPSSSDGTKPITTNNSGLYLRVCSLDNIEKGNIEISLLNSIADLFNLQARKDVVVRVVPPSICALDFIEISFKDQYIGRSDNWR